MPRYNSLCDDFYVNLNLSTEMELPSNRDTVLHFFELLQKKYPGMSNFYSRDRADFVLEEDKFSGSYRWATIEQKRVSSGYVNPPTFQEATQQHLDVLESIPYSLSVSPLDCESLNLMYGFDFNYRGNQHELLAEVFGMSPAFEKLRETSNSRLLAFDPMIQLALDDDCRTQCRLNIESRTSAYHVRTCEYPDEQMTVYLTVRRYGSLDLGETYATAFEQLIKYGEDLMDSHIIEHVLVPLRQAIAIK
jgi:hypothetical protein